MSIKECDHHEKKWHKRLHRLGACLLITGFTVLLVVLLIWAILRPTKPRFLLQDATLYSFNLTAPTLLTSVFQVTLQARNPNDVVGVYYDHLVVYATYRDQQITLPTGVPPAYQGRHDSDVWSPFIYGNSVPIAPFIGAAISQDRTVGSVLLIIKLDGRVRWRVGSFVSGPYHLHVTCPAVITFGNSNTGVVIENNAVKYQLAQGCSVNV